MICLSIFVVGKWMWWL